MKEKGPFLEVVRFFQGRPTAIPGSPEYNAAFCHLLVSAASADAASIWQLDAEDQLHLISSTDIPHDEAMNITLRQGEGIAGAAGLSRQTVSVVNAQKEKLHDSRVDERLGLRTYVDYPDKSLLHRRHKPPVACRSSVMDSYHLAPVTRRLVTA